jgi:hypothetical protein
MIQLIWQYYYSLIKVTLIFNHEIFMLLLMNNLLLMSLLFDDEIFMAEWMI